MENPNAPKSIQQRAPLSEAISLMTNNDIRHLPVLDGDALVGIVSDRDLGIIETLRRDDLGEITVAEAMTPNPLTVPATTPVAEVARTMAEHKYGCVIVTDDRGTVVGLFTTTDALQVIADSGTTASVGECLART